MNILFISPSYFPLIGGTEQAICELASRLKSKNKTAIVTIRWGKDMKPFEIIDGIEVYRTKGFTIKGLTLFFDYLSLFILACKLHKKFKFDLVHLFHVYDCGGTAFLLKKIVSIPFIITLAGWDTYSPVKRVQKKYMPIMRITMNAANRITAPSHHLSNAAGMQGCKQDIKIIPHGSSMHKKISQIDNDIINSLNINKRSVVLSVQRLDRVKGLDYLIEAVSQIYKQHPDILFIIIGKGEDEERLKRRTKELNIEKQVLFAGYIEHEKLPSYYSMADLFVLPSLYEAFGLVYIEAMCFGIPIVTTINGGSTDIINEKIGILVPPQDAVKLGEAVIESLNRKWDREAIKNEAKKYTWDDIVQRYERLYEQIAHTK